MCRPVNLLNGRLMILGLHLHPRPQGTTDSSQAQAGPDFGPSLLKKSEREARFTHAILALVLPAPKPPKAMR